MNMINRVPQDTFFLKRMSYYRSSIENHFKKNPFATTSDVIYNLLIDDIIKMKLWPGDPLKERDISNLMGVSRTPVRTAIDKLLENKFASKISIKKTVISVYSIKDCENMLTMRSALEERAAKLVTLNITKKQKDYLYRLACEADMCNEKNIDTFLHKDDMFHKTLFLYSNDWFLLNCYKSLNKHIMRIRYFINALNQKDLIKIVNLKDHKIFCNILELNSPEISGVFIREHIERLLNTIQSENWEEYMDSLKSIF